MWNILIAEDDLETVKSLTEGLKSHAKCTAVHNGEDAVSEYKNSISAQKPFDFILLDITMPIMDGFEALKLIREAELDPEINAETETYIVMITTYEDSLMDKINMGWDHFISKPIENDKLLTLLKSLAKDAAINSK